MPGLPFEQLPNSPYALIDKELESAFDIAKQQERDLKRNTPTKNMGSPEYRQSIAQIQSQYDNNKYKLMQMRGQLDTIKGLINQGHIDPQAGNQTMQRIVGLPVAQPQKQGTPWSVSMLQSEPFKRTILEFAEAAPEQPGWEWGKPKRSLEDLAAQYMAWRELIQYDYQPPTHQRQADVQWDAVMAGQSWSKWNSKNKTGWNPNDPQVKALRPTGRLQRAVAKDISPLAASILKNKPKPHAIVDGKEYSIEQPTNSREGLLQEYKRLGGSKTEQGRMFADKYLSE